MTAGNCGKGKSFLAESGANSNHPSGRHNGKPKFEQDNLECQSSGNHLRESPEVLSRLGLQAECQKNLGFFNAALLSTTGKPKFTEDTVTIRKEEDSHTL